MYYSFCGNVQIRIKCQTITSCHNIQLLTSMIDGSWTFQNIYTYGTVNSIFVEIQADSTNIKMQSLEISNKEWWNREILVQTPIIEYSICKYCSPGNSGLFWFLL